jgi:hypothetical protein
VQFPVDQRRKTAFYSPPPQIEQKSRGSKTVEESLTDNNEDEASDHEPFEIMTARRVQLTYTRVTLVVSAIPQRASSVYAKTFDTARSTLP